MKKILSLMMVIIGISLLMTITVYADVQIPDINSGWYWPVHSSQNNLYSPYGGWRTLSDGKDLHQGIDLCGGSDLSIYASRAGDVAFKGYSEYYGYYICLYHGEWNGYKIYSAYMHFAEPAYANVGTTVQGGQVIGKMGTTGQSSGTHLHFHIFKTKNYATGPNLGHDTDSQLSANFINTNPSEAMMKDWGLINNHPERFNNSSHPSCKYGTIQYMKVGTPAAPTITSVSTVSTSSLKVKWNAVSGATSYRIDRRRAGDDAYSTIVSSTTSTSFTDTGLLAGEKYYYRVYALNGSGTSDRSESVGAYTQCDIPEITNAVGNSTSSITINWNYVNGASYYRIDRRKQTEDAYYTIVANHTGSRTYTDTGLVAGAKYYYRVYAVNDSSTSAKPDGYGGYTQCEIPTITSVTANSPSSITIKWNGVSGAESYRIDRRKQVDDAYTTIVTGYTSKSYTDTGLETGTKYYYRVYAVTEGSVSAKPDGEGTFTKYIYTVNYNANGGSGAPGSQSKIQDTTLTLSSTKPTRTGYLFVNWNTKADGSGTAYSSGASYTANSDVTLYAQWKINSYYFDLNMVLEDTSGNKVNFGLATADVYINGSLVADDVSDYYVMHPYGTAYEIKDIKVPDGYSYIGISDRPLSGKIGEGKWNVNLVFSTGTYYLDVNRILDGIPDNKGSLNFATVDVYIDGILVADDVTDYYAMHPYGTTYEIKDIKAATGYSYSGGSEGGISGKIDNATTVVGIDFKTNKYIVKYNGNGADSGNMNTTEHTYGTTSNLSINKFERKGYKFKGWAIDSQSVAVYADEQEITNLASQDNEIVNLYAQWERLIPDTNSTVTKKGTTYLITVVPIDIDDSCEIIIAGYEGNKFVTLTSIPYESEAINTTLYGDIDEIKVMVWNSLSGVKPLCESEVIPSSAFIIE